MDVTAQDLSYSTEASRPNKRATTSVTSHLSNAASVQDVSTAANALDQDKAILHSISAAELAQQQGSSDEGSVDTRAGSPATLTSAAVSSEEQTRPSELREYSTVEEGDAGSTEYRMFFSICGASRISPWHSIPMSTQEGSVNFVCEIPKETSAKMEVATCELANPIKQDIKKGKLRHYPYNIHWNYGMIPQTWEDPSHTHSELMCEGDNDPLDVVEIGTRPCRTGGVYQVKPLGVFAMIDDGELDWKVVAICVDDPMAHLLKDVEDVQKHLPGTLDKIHEWFRDYKIPDGKPPNKFGYDAECKDKAFALQVIQETHEAYLGLKSGQCKAAPKSLSLA
ncbi:hypothetical protein CEUSTIGMA_g771.t1 [Chlamydomonas eustigma]|uniref:inorganic diphosphatase n=1 Tax=Chlamydomonas eustigma TaxID=1157962 RepID=A0A250WR49_9CHLO|nr:hypothetical protein CEUSTIGMA_g771.t1 [Chlamydomonas eustigma]|eukprot:GAX73317.1 hypothetical protein CEUSTIGMA_g771.t1 [Chlamydomonas eustigma]